MSSGLSDWELWEVGGMEALERRYTARLALIASIFILVAFIQLVEFIKSSPLLLMTCKVAGGLGLAIGMAVGLYYTGIAVLEAGQACVQFAKFLANCAKSCYQFCKKLCGPRHLDNQDGTNGYDDHLGAHSYGPDDGVPYTPLQTHSRTIRPAVLPADVAETVDTTMLSTSRMQNK